jgi:SAM-dependent methyltransferase
MLAELHEKFVNTTARKPAGRIGRRMYSNPLGHRPGFKLILRHLKLESADSFAEVGCGGGVLLEMALTKAGRAAAVDHSPDMVALARQRNAEAIAAGRLTVELGEGAVLPWADASFSCAANANMFFFVDDPLAFLRENLRILKPGGRLAMITAPRSRLTQFLWGVYGLRLYRDSELSLMLEQAGFEAVRVASRLGHQLSLARKPLRDQAGA